MSGRPILCIGSKIGDAARIIKETHAGQTIGFEDKEKMKEALKDLYQRHLEGLLTDNTSSNIEQYSRKALTGKYAGLLDEVNENRAI